MRSTYVQALRNNRADMVLVQVALAQFTWLSLSHYEVKHWESDLPKHSFISRPLTTRIKGDGISEGNGSRAFYLHITTEKLFSKSPKTVTEWGLYCNIWKWAIQADLANHSNGVFLAQPSRRPLSPDCTAFAKILAPLSLNRSSPLCTLISVVLTSCAVCVVMLVLSDPSLCTFTASPAHSPLFFHRRERVTLLFVVIMLSTVVLSKPAYHI